MAYSRTRARDADRAKANEVLASAFADGQLSRAEYDARVDKVQIARTFADLDEQLFDLQKPGEQSWQAPGVDSKPRALSESTTLLKGAGLAAVAAIILGFLLPQVFSNDSADVPNVGSQVEPTNKQPEPIKDPRTAEGYTAFLKEMQAKLQTTKMTTAYLSEDSVSVTIPVSPDKGRRYITWSWDGEWSEFNTGKYSDSEEVWTLDLKKVDATTFGASMELAFGRIEDPETAILSIEPDGKTCYNIYVSNRFDESFYGRFTCTGKLVEET